MDCEGVGRDIKKTNELGGRETSWAAGGRQNKLGDDKTKRVAKRRSLKPQQKGAEVEDTHSRHEEEA